MERRNDGTKRILRLAAFAFHLSIIPSFAVAQKRAITFEDYIALKAVSDPQLSPDGKWVAYTVSTPSLQDDRNVSRIWVAELATGRSRQLTGGPGGGGGGGPTGSRAGRPTGRPWHSSRRARAGRRSGCCRSEEGTPARSPVSPTARPIRCGFPTARRCWS
jgi:hypothetical protein